MSILMKLCAVINVIISFCLFASCANQPADAPLVFALAAYLFLSAFILLRADRPVTWIGLYFKRKAEEERQRLEQLKKRDGLD